MDLSEAIKKIRAEKGITQAEIARRLNLERGNYSRLEGRGKKLTIEQLESIAQALEITLLDILTWGENTPKVQNIEEKDKEIEVLRERVKELKENVNDLREINSLHIENQKYREEAAKNYYKELKELEGKITWDGDDDDEIYTGLQIILTSMHLMAALAGMDKED